MGGKIWHDTQILFVGIADGKISNFFSKEIAVIRTSVPLIAGGIRLENMVNVADANCRTMEFSSVKNRR